MSVRVRPPAPHLPTTLEISMVTVGLLLRLEKIDVLILNLCNLWIEPSRL